MEFLKSLIQRAFIEDCVEEDITTLGCVWEERLGEGRLVLKRDGVIAGLKFLPQIFQWRDPKIEAELFVDEGQFCKKGTILGSFRGSVHSLLSGERTALNLLQHLSGIATLTAEFVKRAAGVQILDTRKTLPGYRELQKYAVRCGGGVNHRLHLGDAILIKNNHIALVGLAESARRAKERFPGRRVEVEVGSFEELKVALGLGVDAVLLDNMSPDEVRRCVEWTGKRVWLEASGGIGLESVAEYAKTGVDAISIGALTHSAPALDIAFRIA